MASKPEYLEGELHAALRGEIIHGDTLTPEGIKSWFLDEINGYSSLDYQDSKTSHYAYSALDAAYSWRFLKGTELTVLGLGSSFGSEFSLIARRIKNLTIIEPEKKYWQNSLFGVPCDYRSPAESGALAFEEKSFDLVTAFGVLHHIPNVSKVFSEMVRVLRPGGQLIIREPIVSMGDWRCERPGLTKHERGIPLNPMRKLIAQHSCAVKHEAIIGFGPLLHIAARLSEIDPWNSRSFVTLDAFFSRMFAWNYTYHRTSLLRRFAPTLGHWVILKSEGK